MDSIRRIAKTASDLTRLLVEVYNLVMTAFNLIIALREQPELFEGENTCFCENLTDVE